MNDRNLNTRFPRHCFRLAEGILLALMLVAMAPGIGAAALFCGDLENESIERLTGCSVGSETLEGLLLSAFENGDLTLQLSILSDRGPAPPSRAHPSVLIINPETYEDEAVRDADNEVASPSTPPGGESAAGQTEVVDPQQFYSDEDWYYLNLNGDGTYLFFNEPKPDELATEEFSLEDQIPNQVGFGKYWRF
ncbi:MAG: hypothetical protein PVF20_03810 [Desulfobacterales bacterium]|jgi:hypothetical protein